MQFLVVHQFAPSPVSICSSDFGSGLIIRPKKSTNTISTTARARSSACYPTKCTVVNRTGSNAIERRSANYEPSIWSFDYIQSLTSEYKGEPFTSRVNKLEGEVKNMLVEMENSLAQLELIDTLERLGLSYRLENEINTILENLFSCYMNNPNYNLHAIALEFRLLRQHGYAVPQEVFNIFKDETGKFKASISDDIMGVLALYEASFCEKKGESVLEEARVFTIEHLKNYLIMIEKNKPTNNDDHDYNIQVVSHALELPLHWRTTRTEAKWFIDVYENKQDMSPTLLEFAKLDFNMIQSTHHEELKHIFRWWRDTKLGEKLNFARDRLMECFLWKVGVRFEPKFSYFRTITAKLYELITLIDDIYDVYGTLEELELFTNAVERWDVKMINELPDYMKMPFLVLHNTINEMVFEVLRDQDIVINIEHLKKTWVDMCRSFLQEAKWYYSSYTPTLQQYIDNAWKSVGGPVLIVHAYFSHGNHTITNEVLECLEEGYPPIIQQSAIILRLANDLATSSEEFKRGDAPKSIQCYMQETNVSEDEARQHIKFLISETWKEMNNPEGLCASSSMIEDARNFARMGLFMYQHGDGHSSQDKQSIERISALIIKPIPLINKNV